MGVSQRTLEPKPRARPVAEAQREGATVSFVSEAMGPRAPGISRLRRVEGELLRVVSGQSCEKVGLIW